MEKKLSQFLIISVAFETQRRTEWTQIFNFSVWEKSNLKKRRFLKNSFLQLWNKSIILQIIW